MYRKKILPLEIASKYGHFQSAPLSPADFESKPLVLFIGGYSVGKSSFIRYLLGRDHPGIRIGPEPTTDRFTAIYSATNGERVTPGAALASQMDKPFRGLGPFGNNFLSRFEGIEINSPVLNNVTLIDTPGILSGDKQNSRGYDYEGVMKWFAERADVSLTRARARTPLNRSLARRSRERLERAPLSSSRASRKSASLISGTPSLPPPGLLTHVYIMADDHHHVRRNEARHLRRA